MGETKIVNRLLFATVFMTAALTALVAAAQSDGGSAGRQRGAMLPFEAVLRPDQKHQLYAIVKADKTKLQTLHQRLHTAREALIQKLLSPDPSVDVSKETADLKAAQAAMIDERVTIALAARKLLSTQQLKDAATFHKRMEELHRQEDQLMEQMESSKGSPAPGQE